MRVMRAFVCGLGCVSLLGAPCFGAKINNPMERHVVKRVEGPKIRVLIAESVPSALLEVKGDYRVFREDRESLLSFGHLGKRFIVHGMKEGLRWGEEYPDCYEIFIRPQSSDSSIFINGMQYKGTLCVIQGDDNCITLVNEISIEDYLKSVLAYSLNRPLSDEAMAALVITARTQAFFKKETALPHALWDVVAQEEGYFGYGVTQRGNQIDHAIELTPHMIMELLESGDVFEPVWSAHEEKKNVTLSLAAAEELARRGMDAKRILLASFPKAQIGIIADPIATHVR